MSLKTLLAQTALLIASFGLSAPAKEPSRLFVQSTNNITIVAREGCTEVLTCSGVSSKRPAWKKLGVNSILRVPEDAFSTPIGENDQLLFWQNSLVFQFVQTEDRGRYTCDIGGQALSRDLTVLEGVAIMDNVSISHVDSGEKVEVECRVDTCLSDVVIQFFKGDELLDSSLSEVEKGWMGTLQLRTAEDLAGEYVCQAMSDAANLVLRQSFSIPGFQD